VHGVPCGLFWCCGPEALFFHRIDKPENEAHSARAGGPPHGITGDRHDPRSFARRMARR
jgi:hypothetical protein